MRFIPLAFVVVLIETCFGVEVERPPRTPAAEADTLPSDDGTDSDELDTDTGDLDLPPDDTDALTDPIEPDPGAACAPTGCSGEVCAPVGSEVFTTCQYLPEYACFAHTTCGPFGPDGTCAWDLNDAWQDCIDGLGSGTGSGAF